MRAAFNAGRLDVDNFLREQGITPDLFDEWMELDSVSPLGNEPLAWVMAIGFSALLNRLKLICESQFIGLKNVPDIKPKDFIPWHKPPRTKSAKSNQYVSPNAGVMAVRAAVAKAV